MEGVVEVEVVEVEEQLPHWDQSNTTWTMKEVEVLIITTTDAEQFFIIIIIMEEASGWQESSWQWGHFENWKNSLSMELVLIVLNYPSPYLVI